jgi:hypothetical protein
MSGQSRVLTGTGRVMGASEATSVQLAMRRRHRNLNQIPAQERHCCNIAQHCCNVAERMSARRPGRSAGVQRSLKVHTSTHAQAQHRPRQCRAQCRAKQPLWEAAHRHVSCCARHRHVSCTRAVLGVCRAKVVLERRARDRRRKPALLLQWPRTTNRPTAPLQRGTPNVVRYM